MHQKKLLLLVFLAITGLVVFKVLPLGNSITPPPAVSPTPTVTVQQITLTIDYGSGEKFTHIQEYSASQSAFTFLQQVVSQQGLPFSSKQYPFGTLVESINNFNNSPSKAWIYYVNSKSADVGADQYLVQPGDLIEWKYIRPE